MLTQFLFADTFSLSLGYRNYDQLPVLLVFANYFGCGGLKCFSPFNLSQVRETKLKVFDLSGLFLMFPNIQYQGDCAEDGGGGSSAVRSAERDFSS